MKTQFIRLMLTCLVHTLLTLPASAQRIQLIYNIAPIFYFPPTGASGLQPEAALTAGNDGNLYGTTESTIFKVTTNGALTTLTDFNNANGYGRQGGLTLGPDGNFYGTTATSGSFGYGTVFKVTPNGLLTTLHSFTGGKDGGTAYAGLTLGPDGNLYGTTTYGGNTNANQTGWGTVFKVTPNGLLTTLAWFPNDGTTPGYDSKFGLTLGPDGNFYGTVYLTGYPEPASDGMIYRLDFPPTIINQTTNVAAVLGFSATLSVTATGAAPLTYQWFADSGAISGATNSMLVLTNISNANVGSYYVVVTNWFGSVTSQSIPLAVYSAVRFLPPGNWQGVGYWPNVPMTYTIEVNPPAGTSGYVVQDQFSVLNNSNFFYTVTNVSNPGVFDSVHGQVKWTILSGQPHTLTYQIVPANNATNWMEFSGIFSVGGVDSTIAGPNQMNLLPLHPADNNPPISNQININDMVGYYSAYLRGDNWPVEPSLYVNGGIPPSYVSQAIALYFGGESYVYEPDNGPPPLCWINWSNPTNYTQDYDSTNQSGGGGSGGGGSTTSITMKTLAKISKDVLTNHVQPRRQTPSTAVCEMPKVGRPNVPFLVTILVNPASSVTVYAIEDQIPAGWTVANITSADTSAGGLFDRVSQKVKWGPFVDDNTNVLTYQITPPTNVVGMATFTGTASFDGIGIPITGARQVFFIADTNPPSLTINTPAAGQRWSNAVFTAAGTATDNVAVAGVYLNLNQAGWNLSTTANNWTNWTAALTLTQGSNSISAYAVDTSGNFSPTSTVSMIYVVNALLTVGTNGIGALSPNENGALLPIGKAYSLTATAVAGSGFMFTNWTGGTTLPLGFLTNGPTVQFLMVSNLMLAANFVDTNKPLLNITNIVSGLTVSNAAFTAMGTATDNWAVARVLVELGSNAWVQANGTTHWSSPLTLQPGTNIVRAYAVDTSGNNSLTNSATVNYVLTAPLTIMTNGMGTLSPNYAGQSLRVGQNYSITATPALGFQFMNWTNSLTGAGSSSAIATFMMESNLLLTVTFADTNRPTLSITNLTAGQRLSNAVFIVKGKASDNWKVALVNVQVNNTGWTNAVGTTNWSTVSTLTPGTNKVQAYSVDNSGNISLTNSVSFQFLVTNQLLVTLNGLGSISPNYGNAWLNIGQNYSITATPSNGFVFNDWMFGTQFLSNSSTNIRTLQFSMASNLVVAAYFTETNRPSLTIFAPTNNAKLNSQIVTLNGKAADVWEVTNVWYAVNNGGWNMVASSNGFTSWTAILELNAGTNQIQAYAQNLGGLFSLTNSIKVIVTNRLTLSLTITGNGSIGPKAMTAQKSPGLDHGFTFSLNSSSKVAGHIEYSPDLKHWTTLTNFNGLSTTIQFSDPQATNANQRYYRAVVP